MYQSLCKSYRYFRYISFDIFIQNEYSASNKSQLITFRFRVTLRVLIHAKAKHIVLFSPAWPYWQRSVFNPLYNLIQVYAKIQKKTKYWWSILETRTTSPIFNQFSLGILHSVLHLIIYDFKRAFEFVCYIAL